MFPLCPIDSAQTSGRASNVAFASEILSCDFLSIAVRYHLEYTICFLELAKAQLYLCAAQFAVDAVLVVRCGIHRIIFWEDVVLL